MHAGLLILHRDVDAEALVPHLLERLGDETVRFGGVVEKLEFGKTLATREAGVGKEFLGGGQVVGDLRAGVESGGIGRREVAGGHLAAAEHVADKALAVDGEREGAADAGVVQGFFLDVETEEERAEVNVRVEERGFFLPVDRDFRDRQRGRGMQLPGAKRALLGVLALDRVEDGGAEFDGVTVPVGRALGDTDELVGLPLGEDEVAVADEVAGAGPGGTALGEAAVFFEGRPMQRIPRGVADHRREVGHGIFGGEHQGVVGRGAGAELGEVGELAGVERLAVFQDVEQGGVFGGETRGENAPVGENEIVGGDGIPVGPPGVGPEVKGPREPVGRVFPALGHGGHGGGVRGVVLGEALEERHRDVRVLLGADHVRVEIRGFGEVADVDHLVAVAGFDGGVALGAAGAEQGEEGGEGDGQRGDGAGGREEGHAGRRKGDAGKRKSHAGAAWLGKAAGGPRGAYFFGAWAWISARRLSRAAILATSSSSRFLRSLLFTMLRLAASLTTAAGKVRRRVMRPWSLNELR